MPGVPATDNAAIGWSEETWASLLTAIDRKRCTPFIGAGACFGILPLGQDLAREWATQDKYPFDDWWNLVRVAQYVAVTKRNVFEPKDRIAEQFARVLRPPDFTETDEPHAVLAALDLPVYITTNYDDFMVRALQQQAAPVPKQPVRFVCNWYQEHDTERSPPPAPAPTPQAPMVYHLHGVITDPTSMVLTEDDYLEFLEKVSAEPDRIPARVREAFTTSRLLFMGYSLEDTNFKVLYRKLAYFMKRGGMMGHVAIQLGPRPSDDTPAQADRARRQAEYLREHFQTKDIDVCYCTCRAFAGELRRRWEAFRARKAGGSP